MRKQFAATVRTVTVPKVQPTFRKLSLEEEALILDQANQDTNAVDSGLTEAGRQLELSDALEDLAVVAANIRQASPTEIELIQTAGQMAVAGTDNEPELLLPAMESFGEGKSVAFEDFKEKALALWKNIQEFLKKVWDKIVSFYRVNVVAQHLVGKIDLLIKELSANQGGAAQPANSEAFEKKVQSLHDTLSFNGKPVRNAQELAGAVKATQAVVQYVFNTYASFSIDRVEVVGRALNDISKQGPTKQTFDQMAAALGQKKLPPVPGAAQDHSGQDGEFSVQVSRAFLGGGKLVARSFVLSQNNMTTAASVVERMRKTGVTFEASDAEVTEAPSFAIPRPAEMVQVLKDTQMMLKTMIDYHTRILPAVKQAGDGLRRMSELATQAIDNKKMPADLDTSSLVASYRSAVNFNQAFATWTHQPAIPFYNSLMRTARAVCLLAKETSLAHTQHAPQEKTNGA